jgi:hypothetical protein
MSRYARDLLRPCRSAWQSAHRLRRFSSTSRPPRWFGVSIAALDRHPRRAARGRARPACENREP